MIPPIDLNCDMGEGFGPWPMGDDVALMDWVSSVNIACGYHAGDATVMRRTVAAAIGKGVAVGAHPGFPDLQGFGRRAMRMSGGEVFDITLAQVSTLKGISEALGGRLSHVKPHGSLYNQAAADPEMAAAIARAVSAIDPRLVLYGLSGSFLISEAERIGLRTCSEVFADRNYEADGSLTPRGRPDAFVTDPGTAAERVCEMVGQGTVAASNGQRIPIKAQTVCIHGDGPQALAFARRIHEELVSRGIPIAAP